MATLQPLDAWLSGYPGLVAVQTFGTAVGPVQMVRRSEQSEVFLHVYIEGDGQAYLSRGRASANPTPRTPVGLLLAQADAGGAGGVYFGRPCQWVNQRCDPKLFTTQRFTAEVAETYTKLVQEAVAGQPVVLVGYSGGAWLALQVAGRLPQGQVRGVITLAGNLDPNALNRWHKVAELDVAELPAEALRGIPQRHYAGAQDKVVPPALVQQAAQSLGPCAQMEVVQGLSHTGAWAAHWPEFQAKPWPECQPH